VSTGESVFLIGASQVWNNDSNIGSSIAITRGGTRVSGDMYCKGATSTMREVAVAVAVETPGVGEFTYVLSTKTDPGGTAWVSQPYILAIKVSNVQSDQGGGDQSTTSTSWSSSDADFIGDFPSGQPIFLIATSQVWNNNPSIGSSMAICMGSTRMSGDMYTGGADINNREIAAAIATDTG
jgi:hypothetical protein